MDNSDPLLWYGGALILVMAGFIIVPFLRGKTDLPTAWNIFLLGLIMFTGIGCFEVKYGDWTWHMLQWFQPTRQEVNWYMVACSVFIVTFMLSYRYNPINTAITGRVLRSWPPVTDALLVFVLVFCLILATASLFTMNIFFVGLVLMQVSHKAAVFACVFSFVLWYRNRINPFWLIVFVAVFIWASLFSMALFAGRRLLLSVFLGPILCVYWTHARYWRPIRSMSVLAAAAFVIFIVSLCYSSIRFFTIEEGKSQRSIGAVVQEVKTIRQKRWLENFFAHKLHYFAQWSTHYSLLTQRYVDNGRLPPRPLNTLKFLASYPVPRAIWPNKPQTIGITLVREVVGYKTTTWGVGIAGHGAYEGGLPALVLYAILLALLLRVFDDPLTAQPTNPFLIAMMASAAPHILSIPRGDMGIMTIETIECFFFAVALAIACRLLFGTQRAARGQYAVSAPFQARGYRYSS